MNRRKRLLIIALAALLVVALVAIGLVVRQRRADRHRVFRPNAPAPVGAPAGAIPPVAQWTATFASLEPAELATLLARIEKEQPENYAQQSLGYLHARTLLESNEPDDARQHLQPFLKPASPLHDLALYHASEIEDADGDAAEASRYRQELITKHPHSVWFDEAVDEELEHLGDAADPQKLIAFGDRLAPSASTARRREVSSRIVEALARHNALADAKTRAIMLLKGESGDDAADRAARVLDSDALRPQLNADESALLGEAMKDHRHYDRAIEHLRKALGAEKVPAKRDELLFSIGRAHFGAERYADAMKTYAAAAPAAVDPKMRATLFFHASRCAQLLGDDATAERYFTATLAVPGKFPATTAALTQRIRTAARGGRLPAARVALERLRKEYPKDHAFFEGALAFALAQLSRGDDAGARATLDSIPRAIADDYERAEIAYWRARSLEKSDPTAAVRAYVPVLRSSVPTHFAYLARKRFATPELKPAVDREIALRRAQVANLVKAKQFALAKDVETDRLLLTPSGVAPDLATLQSIYREIPAYRDVMALEPAAFPSLPLDANADRTSRLLALGLFDEAEDGITARWGLRGQKNLLTRSLALNRGAISRESILAAELLAKTLPADFLPDLLPLAARQLLYPRYFASYIEKDAATYDADPTLVLSIMREESRFNPRAKSQAAARGLLQFIITTARDIGRQVGLVDVDPDDLYDPRIIIQLGAKYVATLSKEFGGDRYRTAAAYNAGPKQVALWNRLQPAAGADYFISSINFDETKHYVRKVINSYERYSEIYGKPTATGGVRAEP
jgi:soluble lytic murein transglycosylase-like protein/Tfp pilus assembly protein PilF